MQKKYFIYSAILFIGAMAFLFLNDYFAPFNARTAQKGIDEGLPIFITIDEGQAINAYKTQVAQSKGLFLLPYDIEHASFLTKKGIKKHNQLTYLHLSNQLGENWFSQLLDEADLLFRENQRDTIVKMVAQIPEVMKLNHYFDSISQGKEQLKIWYFPEEKSAANVAVARDWEDSSVAVFYYYFVDPYELSIEKIEN